MLSFAKFVDLNEGGNALKTISVSRIDRENIQPTIDSVLKVLARFGVSRSDVAPLGSTGKKDSSGDIDLGIHSAGMMKKIGQDDLPTALHFLQQELQKVYGEAKYFFGNQVTIGAPLVNKNGKQPDAFVQVDLMFTPSLEASKFYYHSPAEGESEYKGLYRTLLLMAVAIHHDRKDLGQGTTERYWFDRFQGLIKGVEYSDGAKRLAMDKQTITAIPDEVCHILLGPNFNAKDANSFESLWSAIHTPRFMGRASLGAIITTFKEMCAKQHFALPKGV